MPKMSAALRPVDDRRCLRLMLAWSEGDKLAADTVLNEVSEEPTGTPGLMFALVTVAATLAEQTIPDTSAWLRAEILKAAEMDDDA